MTRAGDKLCLRFLSDTPPDEPQAEQVTPMLEDAYLWEFGDKNTK